MKMGSLVTAAMFSVLVSVNTFADERMEEVRKAVLGILSGQVSLDNLVESPIAGIYEATIGNNIYFILLKDNHLIVGDAINIATGASLGDEKKHSAIARVVTDTTVEDMVVFAANGESKRYMTVFTDIDCGYCRRLHREVPILNAAGLEVRYMAFPRAGIGSPSYDKIVTVWCDSNPQSAMTASKNGENLPMSSCENPVANQFQAANQAGINGTPTLVLDDGTVIGGYVPAEELLNRIGLHSN